MRDRLLGAVALVLVMAAAARADDQDPPRGSSIDRPAPDFFFGRPKGSIAVRGSWQFARAESDWYDFVTDQLTLERKDFNSPAVGADVAVTLTRRLDALFSVDFSQATTPSEYRRLVDNNRLPITQETRLREVNLSGGVKFALTEKGREVSRLAWVPRALVPYVGAGAGVLWFDVNQTGDFVDYVDFRVFSDVFSTGGWTPSAHVFGGVDLRLYRRLYLTIDARYAWAAGELGREWIDFDPIDLAGARFSTGINIAF